jgi:lantibiotic modifying enzyme
MLTILTLLRHFVEMYSTLRIRLIYTKIKQFLLITRQFLNRLINEFKNIFREFNSFYLIQISIPKFCESS